MQASQRNEARNMNATKIAACLAENAKRKARDKDAAKPLMRDLAHKAAETCNRDAEPFEA